MSKEEKLRIVFALNFAMIAALVVVGFAARSLGVLAAGGDYVADAVGIGISIAALRLSLHPHGHPRALPLACLINSLVLMAILLAVVLEAVIRLVTGAPEIRGVPVVIVSLAAGVVMIGCAVILRGDGDRSDLNMRAVTLDTIADAAAAFGVAAAGFVILAAHGLYWLDPAIAVVISVVIGHSAFRLLLEAAQELHGLSRHDAVTATERR